MQHDPGRRPPASPEVRAAGGHEHRPAWIDSVPVAVLVAVTAVLAVLVGVVVSTSEPSVAAGAAPAPSSSPSATITNAPPPAPVVPTGEEAQLQAEAARLTTRVSLTAPAAWGPARPTYAHDVDGCPRLAARLSAALGTTMRYLEGTLPAGPYGCTWVPASPSAETYTYGGNAGDAYRLDVGWLADGTTTEALRTASYEHGDRARCPGTGVPAVGAGAVLVRCQEQTTVEYTLALPNRGAPGIWLLHALARDDARRTPAQALEALVGAAGHAYG